MPGLFLHKKQLKTEMRSQQSPQQHRTIKGIVKDANGEPIIGANVIVKGNKTIGVITNLNGEFSLEVPSNATLQISLHRLSQ